MRNLAYIDGQNLFYGHDPKRSTMESNLFRFRVYLKKKYMVDKAFIILDMYKMVLSINSSMKKFRLQVLFWCFVNTIQRCLAQRRKCRFDIIFLL